MIYGLQAPLQFVGLVLALLATLALRGWAQALLARPAGLDAALRAEQMDRPDPRRHVDPFGLVAAGFAGPGWGRPLPLGDETRVGARRLATVLLVPDLALVALGAGLLLLSPAALLLADLGGVTLLAQGRAVDGPGGVALDQLAGVPLAVGLLCLLPLPPLDGGRVLLALGRRRSKGWQTFEDWTLGRNVGVAVLLLLALLDVLALVVDALASPLVALLGGSR